MAINFGANQVDAINFKDTSYVAVTDITISQGTYYRNPSYDGTCADPNYQYAWHNDDAQYEQTVFTRLASPSIGNDVYYQNGSWFDVISSETEQPVPRPVYAVKFNDTYIFGVTRHLNVYYDSTQVEPITVNRRTVGYEPTAQAGIMYGTYIVGGMTYSVYPGDEIEVFAVAKTGYRILSGTGSFNVDMNDTDINITIVSVPDSLVISGNIYYMVADDRTTETVHVVNHLASSIGLLSISGRKVSENPNYSFPLLLAPEESVDLVTYCIFQ